MTVFYIPDVRILFSKKTEDILKTCQAHGLDYKIHQSNVAVQLLLHTKYTQIKESVLCYVICYIYLFTTLLRNDGRSTRSGKDGNGDGCGFSGWRQKMRIYDFAEGNNFSIF